MSNSDRLKPCAAIEVDGDWYVIPKNRQDEFNADAENEDMHDTGEFTDKWGEFLTGGDLNLVQLYRHFN